MNVIPSLKRFEYNEITNSYEKRMIIDDKVYRILIPETRWSVKTRQNIQYWFTVHKDPINTAFPYGDIHQEEGTNVIDVLNNACEYCGRRLKSIKNKRNHMKNCKYIPYEDRDNEYKITHELESNITEEVADEPTTSPGIVYLIQPGNLKGTNRYKFGCSKSQTFRRCNGYGIETKVVTVLKVDDPYKAETFILRELCKKYKPYYGNEWFDCDEEVIYNDVLEAFIEYRKLI